jgi:hypothetical protein
MLHRIRRRGRHGTDIGAREPDPGAVRPSSRTRRDDPEVTMRIRSARLALASIGITVLTVVAAGPAAACGGLVGENGSISLLRTTTLAAWHDGVEHYVTFFEFAGEGQAVGSIVPLPGVPTDVEAAGRWTLQRLQLEVEPPLEEAQFDEAAGTARSAEVLLETEVDALDITVLRGGGDEVGEWALDNGFFLTPDAPEMLDFYADRSQVFMAARFNTQRAAEQGLAGGQGTPVHLTIPTPRPWVPLRILGLGLDADQVVEADVFLLTDDEPDLLAGGRGLDLARSEPASALLLDDLRADQGMEWIPADMWFTHLTLAEDAGDLEYDLSASAGRRGPSLADAGLEFAGVQRAGDAVDPADEGVDIGRVAAWVGLAGGFALLAVAGRLRLRADR